MPEFKFKGTITFTVEAKDDEEAHDIITDKDWWDDSVGLGVTDIEIGWLQDISEDDDA